MENKESGYLFYRNGTADFTDFTDWNGNGIGLGCGPAWFANFRIRFTSEVEGFIFSANAHR